MGLEGKTLQVLALLLVSPSQRDRHSISSASKERESNVRPAREEPDPLRPPRRLVQEHDPREHVVHVQRERQPLTHDGAGDVLQLIWLEVLAKVCVSP